MLFLRPSPFRIPLRGGQHLLPSRSTKASGWRTHERTTSSLSTWQRVLVKTETCMCYRAFMGIKQLRLVREKCHGGCPRPSKCLIKNVVYTKYHQSCNKRKLNCRMVTKPAHGDKEAESKETSWARRQNHEKYPYQKVIYTTVPFSFRTIGQIPSAFHLSTIS